MRYPIFDRRRAKKRFGIQNDLVRLVFRLAGPPVINLDSAHPGEVKPVAGDEHQVARQCRRPDEKIMNSERVSMSSSDGDIF